MSGLVDGANFSVAGRAPRGAAARVHRGAREEERRFSRRLHIRRIAMDERHGEGPVVENSSKLSRPTLPHSPSNTTSPPTSVSFTRPSIFASSKGVFLQRERSFAGSTT